MKPHHSRSIGTVALFAIASGTMISSGIFILPGLAYSRIGPMVILAYALAGLVAFSASLALIELSTAMPKAGGDYFYITRSLGPGIGTVMGLLSWIALMLKTAFAVYGLSELAYVLLGVPPVVSALALTALFVLLNLAGTGEAVKLEILLVFALLAIMLAYIVSGFFRWDASNFAPEAWRPVIDSAGGEMGREGLFPGFLGSVRRLFSNAAFVFVSFGGLLNVTTMAEGGPGSQAEHTPGHDPVGYGDQSGLCGHGGHYRRTPVPRRVRRIADPHCRRGGGGHRFSWSDYRHHCLGPGVYNHRECRPHVGQQIPAGNEPGQSAAAGDRGHRSPGYSDPGDSADRRRHCRCGAHAPGSTGTAGLHGDSSDIPGHQCRGNNSAGKRHAQLSATVPDSPAIRSPR
jgi:hypothetical protein